MLIKKIKKELCKAKEKISDLIKLIPILFAQRKNNHDMIIITGADSSHFKSLCQFLSSLLKHESNITVITYDLGLDQQEVEHINKLFPKIETRKFNFESYPDYFNIKKNAGEYAWKPVIFCDVLEEFKTHVCWMDAGNLVTAPLTILRKITYQIGLYSPQSSGTIGEWTHPNCFQYLNGETNLLAERNLNGACISMIYSNDLALKIARAWKACALTKDCIAPVGSNRSNHRQDQSVLSILAHQVGITKNMPILNYEFKVQQDID